MLAIGFWVFDGGFDTAIEFAAQVSRAADVLTQMLGLAVGLAVVAWLAKTYRTLLSWFTAGFAVMVVGAIVALMVEGVPLSAFIAR